MIKPNFLFLLELYWLISLLRSENPNAWPIGMITPNNRNLLNDNIKKSHNEHIINNWPKSRTKSTNSRYIKNYSNMNDLIAAEQKIPVGATVDLNSTTTLTTRPTQITLSLPQFRKNAQGKWVYRVWGATYGKLFEDTRFNIEGLYTIPRMYIDSRPPNHYYPMANLSSVCQERSTLYNIPSVHSWLRRNQYTREVVRPIMQALRMEVYRTGKSEECHFENKTWLEFMECSLMRHQRMEYLIPKYPMHTKTETGVKQSKYHY